MSWGFGVSSAIASLSKFKGRESTHLDQSAGLPKNEEQRSFARLARDSAFELMLTVILLFGVTSIVRWVIGPSPISRAIPEIHAQLAIVGLAVGLLLAGLILSPPGKQSGGHVNPAISLAMWRFGVFPGTGVAPYTVAQLLGSVLGVIAARGVWGPVVAHAPARSVYRGAVVTGFFAYRPPEEGDCLPFWMFSSSLHWQIIPNTAPKIPNPHAQYSTWFR